MKYLRKAKEIAIELGQEVGSSTAIEAISTARKEAAALRDCFVKH